VHWQTNSSQGIFRTWQYYLTVYTTIKITQITENHTRSSHNINVSLYKPMNKNCITFITQPLGKEMDRAPCKHRRRHWRTWGEHQGTNWTTTPSHWKTQGEENGSTRPAIGKWKRKVKDERRKWKETILNLISQS